MLRLFLPAAASIALAGCGNLVAGEDFTPWPFAADSATLSCYVGRVYVTLPNGTKYGVNGTAKGDAPDVAKVTTHWDTQPLIDRGRRLCDAGDKSLVIVRPKDVASSTPSRSTGASLAVDDDGDISLRSLATSVSGGKAPLLSVSCNDPTEPFIYIETGSPPVRPPALRTDGAIAFDGKDQPAAFAWTPDDHWTVREETDAVSILRNALRSRTLRLTLPEAALPSGPITWDVALASAERDKMRKACNL